MTLVFVRHGETALNAARVLQPPDTPLTPRGLAQARALAPRIAAMRPVAVVSSDLPRAVQTSDAIVHAARSAGQALTLQTTPLLQERNFGALRGQSYDTLGFDAINTAAAPPGGESWDAFAQRVDTALAWLLDLHATQARAADGAPPTVVAVTHGLVVRALLQRLPLHASCTLPTRLGNTGVTLVDTQAPHTVTLANCLVHLDGAVLDDGSSLSGG